MIFNEFKQKLAALKVFSPSEIQLIDPNFRLATLYEWEKKGWVRKIRNKWYVFADFQPSDYDYYLLANRIYSPSYISLELALNHYGIIPEVVQQLTSVTTLKTQIFSTDFGVYSYNNLKPGLFFGYKIIEHKQTRIKMAYLEKALLDYLYLNPHIKELEDFEGLRYNHDILQTDLNYERFDNYLTSFASERLNQRANKLKIYIDRGNHAQY